MFCLSPVSVQLWYKPATRVLALENGLCDQNQGDMVFGMFCVHVVWFILVSLPLCSRGVVHTCISAFFTIIMVLLRWALNCNRHNKGLMRMYILHIAAHNCTTIHSKHINTSIHN